MSNKIQQSIILCALIFWGSTSFSAEMPSNDIAIFSLEVNEQVIKMGDKPFNLTLRDGYDNQPKFADNGQSIYFTRAIGQQTDIMRYSFADKSLKNITDSENLSEFSPTPFAEGYLSAIGQTAEGKQYLNKISLETGHSKPFTQAIEPIGYHAWLNPEQAPVFVLGDVMTLQVLDLSGNGQPRVLAENIGRCFERISENKVSFSLEVEGLQHIKVINEKHEISETGIVLPKGVQDYVWLDSVSVVVGSGSKLYKVSKDSTVEFADLAAMGINNISRLAYSATAGKLAVVYER